MPGNYYREIFGEAARELQSRSGSRANYAEQEAFAETRDELTDDELQFLAARDSIYMASITKDGWPYIQHRGGQAGFIKSLGKNVVGFGDYPGNRQYVSLGNVIETERVALFCVDYPARRRLKLIGNAKVIKAEKEPTLVENLPRPAWAGARTAVLIEIIGFDWNCSKFIEPRFTRPEIERAYRQLIEENANLRLELSQLRGELP